MIVKEATPTCAAMLLSGEQGEKFRNFPRCGGSQDTSLQNHHGKCRHLARWQCQTRDQWTHAVFYECLRAKSSKAASCSLGKTAPRTTKSCPRCNLHYQQDKSKSKSDVK